MNIKLLLAVVTCCVYINAEESFKVYRNLGEQSIFEKKNVTDYHESKVDDYDFEKNALIFRGFGAAPNWGELPVLRITCFRVIQNGNHEIDALTFFNVMSARSVDSKVKHELDSYISIPLDMPVKPSSVIFRVVPREYRGTIDNGVLIEGASYVFARRHRNIEFIDVFTVPIGLKGNTVTTFHWNIERKNDKIEKNQLTSVNLTFGNKIDFSSKYAVLSVATILFCVLLFMARTLQSDEIHHSVNENSGDDASLKLIGTSSNPSNHHERFLPAFEGMKDTYLIARLHPIGMPRTLRTIRYYAVDTEMLNDLQNRVPFFDFKAHILGEGTLVLGRTTGTASLECAFYIVKFDGKALYFPVTKFRTDEEMGMLVPGLDRMIRRKSVTVNDFTQRITVRNSEQDGPFELVELEWQNIRGIRPVPRPDNEETAELRGTVEVGTTMEAAFRRLEAFKKGEMHHPPAGSSWNHLWHVGDGLLAIERNGETDEVSKLAYIQWPESESPMTLELSRIYLTDGEMVMPIPPPPVPIPTPTPPTPDPFGQFMDPTKPRQKR